TRVRHEVLTHCADTLKKLYIMLDDGATYKPDAAGMARRALKGITLDYLTSRGDGTSVTLAAGQYNRADNMTDRMMGLRAMMDTESPVREDILKDFYTKFRDYPLVIDKWFAAQATAVRPQTLDDVSRLA